MKIYSILLILIFCKGMLLAQVPPKLSSNLRHLHPEELFQDNPEMGYIFSDLSRKSTLQVRRAIGYPIFRAQVPEAMPHHYDIQLSWKNKGAIKKGDVLLARFSIRTLSAKRESGEGSVHFYVQQLHAPYQKLILMELGPGSEWRDYDVPFVAERDFSPGEGGTYFSFGGAKQEVELSGFSLLNFGQRIRLSDLPVTRLSYEGRGAGAAWRKAALKRIKQIRMAPLTVRVSDRNGIPQKNVKVHVRQVESDFAFGSAVSARMINGSDEDSRIYREYVDTLFNTVTLENGLKWPVWRESGGRSQSLKAVEWISQHHLRLRGHNLVWPGAQFTPRIYSRNPGFVDGFKDTIHQHIREEVRSLRGKVVSWDVINEMLHEKDYFSDMPRTEAALWFKEAKSEDPDALLVLNEYDMLNGSSSPRVIESFLNLVNELKRYGAPIEALGIQAHLGRQPRSPELVLKDLDALTKAGLPIEITEFDMDTDDESLQADYTRDFLIACFSHPQVKGFVMWGFWAGAHWLPRAAMYRRDWTPKPSAKIWNDLVLNEWRSRYAAGTDKKGKINCRAFLGKYEIQVENPRGKTSRLSYDLKPGGGVVDIRLP